jgi:hypothetical protein
MMGQGGFTLIEALVAGTISVIIPGVIITLLHVSNSGLAASSAQMRLSQMARVVSEDLQRSADSCTTVLLGPGAGCSAGPSIPLDHIGVSFCSAGDSTIKAYQVVRQPGDSTGRLREWVSGSGWADFVVGPDTIEVQWDPTRYVQKDGGLLGVGSTPPAGSPNAIPNKFVWINFRYNMKVGGLRTTLPMQTETFQCRN